MCVCVCAVTCFKFKRKKGCTHKKFETTGMNPLVKFEKNFKSF
jgi:hypothetical protein